MNSHSHSKEHLLAPPEFDSILDTYNYLEVALKLTRCMRFFTIFLVVCATGPLYMPSTIHATTNVGVHREWASVKWDIYKV